MKVNELGDINSGFSSFPIPPVRIHCCDPKEGTKYDDNKLRLDLLPFDALMEVAEVYSMGAKKYEDRNWEKGIKYMRIVGALLRHLFAWVCGEERASDDKQRHLASVVWCGLALLTYELRGMKEWDDRPCPPKK